MNIIHEVKVGAILGIRGWEIDRAFRVGFTDSKLRLKSCLSVDGIWEPNTVRVARTHKDLAGCDDCPGTSAPCIATGFTGYCRCGIYAVKAVELFNRHNSICSTPITILGIISMFGRVVECEWGWRTEKATIHTIANNHSKSKFAAENYGVLLVPLSDLDHIVAEANLQ